ncbi:hypothetical protein EPO05_07200, partial [Patescibacteria group bacterium]
MSGCYSSDPLINLIDRVEKLEKLDTMRLDTIKYMDRSCEELHKGIQRQIDKLEENIEQLHHSNCKRIEENTLISRRLSEIEFKLERIEKLDAALHFLTDMFKELSISVDGFHDDTQKIKEKIDKLEKAYINLEIHKVKQDAKVEGLEKENAMRIDTIACIDRAYDESHKEIENRLEKLESAYKADFETAKDLIHEGAKTHASILRCESKLKELERDSKIYSNSFGWISVKTRLPELTI